MIGKHLGPLYLFKNIKNVKIKVEIDVSDLVAETEEYGEYNLKEELENSIRNEVKHAVVSQLRSLVLDTFKSDLQEQIKKDLPNTVQLILDELAAQTMTIPEAKILEDGEWKTKTDVTMLDYIKSRVHQNLFDANTQREFNRNIDKIATVTVNQFRSEFDHYFATQIVKKMGEQGLLKEDVGKMLIGGK